MLSFSIEKYCSNHWHLVISSFLVKLQLHGLSRNVHFIKNSCIIVIIISLFVTEHDIDLAVRLVYHYLPSTSWTRGHYVDWVFSPCLTARVFSAITEVFLANTSLQPIIWGNVLQVCWPLYPKMMSVLDFASTLLLFSLDIALTMERWLHKLAGRCLNPVRPHP